MDSAWLPEPRAFRGADREGRSMSGKNGGPRPFPDGETPNPIELVLGKLSGVKRRGKGWRACCPSHDDKHPSLDIDIADDGRVLLICWSKGCSLDRICAALGIRPADLFPTNGRIRPVRRAPKGRIATTYDYRDETGNLLFQAVRFEPKDFKQRRPDGQGGFIWNLQGVRRILYKLHELLAADPNAWVFIVEGEKDADRLISLGLIATTNPMGGGHWDKVDASQLYGRRVVSLRDNDPQGLKHRAAVLRSLLGRAKDLRAVDLPGLPEKGDVSDWLDAGHTVTELLALVEAAAPVTELPPTDDSDSTSDQTGDWEPPIPFGQYDLPAFPLDAIPSQLCGFREFCVAVTESLQVPIDGVVLLALSVGGSALAKRIEVHVLPDWTEPVNIYVVVAMESGERKSGLFRRVVAPLVEFEKAENERLAPLIEHYRAELAMLGAELKHNQAQAAKAKKPEDRQAARERVKELVDHIRTSKPILPLQLIADDATPEAIGMLLHEQGGRVALMSPEGDIFDLMAGRYSEGVGRLGVYLKGHAGDDHRLNRVGRPSENVPKPAISVGLAVQPEVLRGLMEKPGFRGRGLLARFLYSLPHSLVGSRKIRTRPVPPELASYYEKLIAGALELPLATDDSGNPCPRALQLAPEALAELDRFREWAEGELRIGKGLSNIRDWGNKLSGVVCRIAGIMHGLIHAHRDPAAEPISVETMLCAIAIAEYLIAHAKAAFSEMGANPATAIARRILAWATDKKLADFSRRDAFNGIRGAVQKVEELDDPLRLLSEHGFIRQRDIQRTGPGRKPSDRYVVNPWVLAQNPHNPHNSKVGRHSADIAQSAEGGPE